MTAHNKLKMRRYQTRIVSEKPPMRICVLTGQAYLQLKHVGGLGRFWGKRDRGDMGRCGKNSERWKLETMQECRERTGVWWKKYTARQGAGDAGRGEPGGHRKAGCISSAECQCGNLKSEKPLGAILYFSELIIMG